MHRAFIREGSAGTASAPLVPPLLRLHPTPSASHQCPGCGIELEVLGVYVPGMRMLADLACATCRTRYYGDLPAGHGLGYPALLEAATGAVHHRDTLVVFADYLARSYRERSNERLGFQVESFRPLRRPILLNCLDWVYGHSVLKLLNAQHHLDHHANYDLVLLVPRFLRWMVPDGVAEVWTVELPLARSWIWSDWLAEEIRQRFEAAGEWLLSPAFSHPDPTKIAIERFTRVAPFPLAEWRERSERLPTVTYVWRGDREWIPEGRDSTWSRNVARVARRLGVRERSRTAPIVEFAERLREELGRLDFAVIGVDTAGSLPPWIRDLRTSRPTPEVERDWCRRSAESHLVVGVHGSNMLIPSAHSGGLMEFVPDAEWDSRWGNIIQDVLVRGEDVRDVLFRYRFLPVEVKPREAARVAASLIRDWPSAWLLFDPEFNDHARLDDFWRQLPEQLRTGKP